MLSDAGGLAGLVRTKLDEGTPVEDVIHDLVSRGLSRQTAQRFVDRALDESRPPAPVADKDLTPGGAAIDRPFPWKRVLAAAVIPGTVIVGFLGWSVIEGRQKAAAELAAADRSRAERIREESKIQRDAANEVAAARHFARARMAVEQLRVAHPSTQCDAALLLGQLRAREYIRELTDLLDTAESDGVRDCAAAALVSLGEYDRAMTTYISWAQSTDSYLRRSAVIGFGDIGPSAAHVAVPYLTESLKSPHWDIRYTTVESLGKLGPAGVPLLQVAAKDSEKLVRDRAALILQRKR
jgi:hypothetical protein